MKKIILPVAILLASLASISQSPVLLRDIFPGSTGSSIQQIVKTTNYTFFNAEDDDADADRGLYRTDGTPGGTIKLNLTYPTYISTKADKLTALGDKVVFAGDNLTNYGELWVSDGTQAGTIALERYQPSISTTRPVISDISRLNSEILYSVRNTDNHLLLKKTDGNPGAPAVVYDFGVAPNGNAQVTLFNVINGILYFIVYDGLETDQLWRSDGTAAGTYLLKDFAAVRYVASFMMPAGGNFYIMIVEPGTGNVLWKSDGTAAGTLPVKTIGTSGNNNYPPNAAIGSTLYFAGLDGNGKELWKTDGTEAGTILVADINPGSASSNPVSMAVLNGNLYFTANTSVGNELWKFDGNTASLVKDIYPGASSSNASQMVESNGTLIFSAANDATGVEPWITDGTAANTKQLADINPAGSSIPSWFTPGNPVYFAANNGVNGSEIFKYDNSVSIPNIHSKIYVNDNSTANDVFTTTVGNNANAGTKAAPVATLTYAISIAQPGDTVIVDAGAYPERVFVNKPLYFKGAYAGVNPGSSLNRGAAETILIPSAENNILEIVTVQSAGVTFDGFLFDGDNPSITGSITLNGVDVNAGMGIYNGNLQTDNLIVKNNIFKNFYRYALLIQKGTTPATNGNQVTRNHIDNISSRAVRDGRAVGFFANVYGSITENLMTRVHAGPFIANANAGSVDSLVISSNTIEAYNNGIIFSNVNNLATSVHINDNQISLADLNSWTAPGSSTTNFCTGINLGGVSNSSKITLLNNTVSLVYRGIFLGAVSSASEVALTNNTVTGSQTGIWLDGITTPLGIKISGGSISSSSSVGLFCIGRGAGQGKFVMNNLSLVNNVVGLDASAADANPLPLEFSGVTINGGTTGIRFYGSPLSLPGNALTGISFLNQTKEYILQTFHSFENQTIDASTVSFDGVLPTNMTLTQLFATEDKLTHRIDFDSVGYFKLKAGQVFVTPNSFAADLPTVFGVPTTTPEINRAVGAAASGDIIHIAAGNYINQVNIDKGLTLQGAGAGATIISGPSTPLAALPDFGEKSIIQSLSGIGEVNVRELTIEGQNSDETHAILIQGAGTVHGCEMARTNNGIYFRYGGSIPLTATASENYIHDINYVGINYAGSQLTSVMTRNTLNLAGTVYGMGVIGGFDFGHLPSFTATNNKINNWNGWGIQVNTQVGTITNNHITGSAGYAIQTSSPSPVNATCNWFGSTDAVIVATKVNGMMNYNPWLENGTDNDPATAGFQPVPGSCTGAPRNFYVNDNSQTGDLFTSRTGSNSYNGSPAWPFATITYAISMAQPGDTIIVDAGTFIENVVVNKSLTLRGVKYGQQPGSSLDRGNETIVMPAVNNTVLTGSIIKTLASDITIDGFLLNGDNPGISGGVPVNGIDANAGAGIFNDNSYINNLVVINNIVKNTAVYGIGQARNTTAPAASGALFRYNRVDNCLSRGLALNFNSYGSIRDNHVTGCNNGIWVANSSLVNPAGAPVVISNNIISANTLGIQSSLVNGAAPRVEILNNEVTMAATGNGISVIGGSTSGVTATNNSVTGGLSSVLTNLSTAVSPVVFSNNSFTGFTSKSFETYNGVLINATCNWYGTTSRATIEASMLGNVNYSPWLINGTDTDPARGFQPVANSCIGQPKYYVNDNNLTGDVFTTAVGNNSNNGSPSSPFATPDYAYSIAQAGDTIYVDAGTYDLGGLTYSFPKAIVFLGTNYQVSPNNPSNKLLLNTARNAESILANGKLSIASSGISVEGFTFDVGNRTGVELVNTAPTNNDFGNFKFAKNIYRITHSNAGLNSFAITGKFVTSPALPVTTGYNIADNRFEKSGSSTGNTLNFNYVKNISVTDNSFVVTGTTVKTQQAANMGGTGIIDGLVFSNNTVDEASTAVGGNRIAGALIAGNKMHNVSNALSNTNSMPESSNIEFSNNEIGNDLGTPFMLYNRTGTGTSNLLKVENNTITGVSVAEVNQLFAAMNFTFSNTALNPSFIIRGNKITYSGDFSAVASQFFRPITVRGNIANVTLENNELTLNNTGGLGAVVPATLLPANPAFSIITDNGATSYMPSNAVINVLNNKIHGFKQAVVFYDVANGGHDLYAGYGNIPAGATINVNNNSFTGDSISINNGTIGETVNATCNWYGAAAAQNAASKVSSSTVTYSPWLTNGTDNDIATGFQPVPGSCNGITVDAAITLVTNITCNGSNNGAIAVTITGGSTPYTFAWSKDNVTGFSSSEDLSNLAPGIYQLIVTDANGSVDTVSATITEPAALTAIANGTNVSCFGGANGTAAVIANGGTAPYTYLWSTAATTSSISSLTAGNYAITVTDANGCTTVANYTVTQPPVLTVTMTGTTASCNGSATATPAGGTAPYTYSWSNGSVTQTISGVPNGTYTVIVKDANNCSVNGTYTVNGNSSINPTTQLVDISCFGGSNGSITVTSAGGLAPHTYSINGSPYQSSNVFSGLTAGTYLVSAKDATGCFDFVTRTLTQPLLLAVVQDSLRVPCFGVNNGRIYVTVTGGSGAKTYSWTGPNGFTSTTQDPNNLFAGTYNLVVTDAKGCTTSLVVILAQRPAVSITEVVTNVGCRGEFTGAINATITGGSGSGFVFSWTGPNGFTATTEDISGLRWGNYTLNVTDTDNGCITSKLVTVSQPAANLGLTTSKTNVNGCVSMGTITASASGGTSPYQYSVDGVTYQSSGLFVNLSAGSYTVYAKDANGCITTKVVAITDNGTDQYEGNNSKNQAKVINLSTVINARIAIATDLADWFRFTTGSGGNYMLTFTHPSVSYTFNMYAAGTNAPALLPVSSSATTKEYALAGSTTYYISITGGLSFSCYDLSVAPSVFMGRSMNGDGDELTGKPITTRMNAMAYPNPHKGSFTLKIASPEEGLALIELFTVSGQKIAAKKVEIQVSENNLVPFSGVQPGTVFYRVQIGKHVLTGKVIGAE